MFSRPTQLWFEETFEKETAVQRLGWSAIAQGKHVLLVAPTGSGKTLAAFLWAIDRIARAEAGEGDGVRVLYVSPLKALVYDVERNLRGPLAGIRHTAERLGLPCRDVVVDVRTGDTSQRERRRQASRPGDILVTTPESLFLILGSRARETLGRVETVIIDEVHAVAASKRGAHLALSLERLSALAGRDPQRIGLSATVRPLPEVAAYLGGDRPVKVVDTGEPPNLRLKVRVPVPDMESVRSAESEKPRGGSILAGLYAREVGTPRSERGVWPAIYPQILEQIRSNRSTIVFVNSRGLCERLAQRLNELAGEELVRAHHGSVSREKRTEIEESLKRGTLRALVATSSLELGIDMGAVDGVILVESPGSVARGLQRVGRAGHGVGELSVGQVFPKFRGDLLECAVIAQRMLEGELEELRVPRNPLDVLAQQVVAMCVDHSPSVEEVAVIVRRAYPFRDLSRHALEAVLDMLSGRYPSSDFADLRPLLSWDRAEDRLSARRGAAMVARMNAGTIPDRGNYGVYLGEGGPRVGELDEEMVFETRTGDNILLGASTWRVEEITRDRVLVSPAPGEPGRLPFWRGEGFGRPVELGRAVGAFVRKLGKLAREDAVQWLLTQTPLDRFAAENLAAYVHDQRTHNGALPTDRAITIERFRDELGDWRVCILSPFGGRVHAPWAMALQQLLSLRSGFEVQLMYSDDGIVLRFADIEETPELELFLPDPDQVTDLITEQLGQTALFAGLFRENASRSLLLPRRRPDRRSPLWAQRLKAQSLLGVVRRFPSFPIVLETYRQALSDVFDLPALRDILRKIGSRRISVHTVETKDASPFARSLVFAYVAAYIYEQDAPIAERKAQALTLDRNLLSELLGQAELRELVDPGVLAGLEAELQHLSADRRARDGDEIHDMLRHLGDLTDGELAVRCVADPAPWLQRLATEARAVRVNIAGESRWLAAEDAGLYRDALGVMPPPGLPDSFLAPLESPLEALLRRFARTRGPFLTREAVERYRLTSSRVQSALEALLQIGCLVRGEIRPGGVEPEWCDAEVLRKLKRRTLARLRNQVAPVDPGTMAIFLTRWHGLGGDGRGHARLLEVIEQLEGLPLPWSELSTVLLPRRAADFSLDMLDLLCAGGQLVWVGCGPLGPRDGRIAFYRRDRARVLLRPPPALCPGGPLHEAILDFLGVRGACFLTELESAVDGNLAGATASEFESALWDLVWSGHITNDTLGPLRTLRGTGSRPAMGRRGWGHTLAGGRWSLVRDLLSPAADDTESTVAWAMSLLQRYGIVSRECAQAEAVPGGFQGVSRVLKAMEESGRVRRGYFVEGLSGMQFGLPAAVELLRDSQVEDSAERPIQEQEIRAVAALDPANPFGLLLAWPASASEDKGSARRVPGAWVILARGRPVLYVGPRSRRLTTFPGVADVFPGALEAAFRLLPGLPGGSRRGLRVIERVDGVAVRESAYYEALRQCGFESDYRGLVVSGFHR